MDFDSVGEFVDFLGGSADADAPLVGLQNEYPSIELEGLELDDTDRTLVRYLFRDCRDVQLKELTGGFSGNVVAGSTDLLARLRRAQFAFGRCDMCVPGAGSKASACWPT